MPQPVRPNATRSATWPCRSITTPKFGASRKLEALQTEVPGRERMMAEPASGDARAEHAVDRADRAADNELHQAARSRSGAGGRRVATAYEREGPRRRRDSFRRGPAARTRRDARPHSRPYRASRRFRKPADRDQVRLEQVVDRNPRSDPSSSPLSIIMLTSGSVRSPAERFGEWLTSPRVARSSGATGAGPHCPCAALG